MEPVLDLAVLIDNEYDDDIDEALILHILNDEENLGNRALLYGRFNLENLSNTECKNLFRFSKQDLPILCRGLGIPDMITTADRVTLQGNKQSFSFIKSPLTDKTIQKFKQKHNEHTLNIIYCIVIFCFDW